MAGIATGIGVNIAPAHHAEVEKCRGERLFSFIELDPESFVLDNPLVIEHLSAYGTEYPVVLHSTSLSLCGDNPIPANLLAQVDRVAGVTQACVYSDHLSFNCAGDIYLDLYMPPVFSDEMLRWTVERLRKLHKQLNMTLAVENVALLFPPCAGTYTEIEFIDRVVSNADCGLQLNLDSVAISAFTLGFDPMSYLVSFPKERVSTIAIVPELCMNPLLRTRYGSGIDTLMLQMLDEAMRTSPAQRVIVQRRDGIQIDSIAAFLSEVRQVFSRRRNRQ